MVSTAILRGTPSNTATSPQREKERRELLANQQPKDVKMIFPAPEDTEGVDLYFLQIDLSDNEYETFSTLVFPEPSELQDNPMLSHHFREAERRGLHAVLQHAKMDDYFVAFRKEDPIHPKHYLGLLMGTGDLPDF